MYTPNVTETVSKRRTVVIDEYNYYDSYTHRDTTMDHVHAAADAAINEFDEYDLGFDELSILDSYDSESDVLSEDIPF